MNLRFSSVPCFSPFLPRQIDVFKFAGAKMGALPRPGNRHPDPPVSRPAHCWVATRQWWRHKRRWANTKKVCATSRRVLRLVHWLSAIATGGVAREKCSAPSTSGGRPDDSIAPPTGELDGGAKVVVPRLGFCTGCVVRTPHGVKPHAAITP